MVPSRAAFGAAMSGAEQATDLSRLAVELGYYSPSHFCDRFRAMFGRPPSSLRGTELRTIVEAVRAAAS